MYASKKKMVGHEKGKGGGLTEHLRAIMKGSRQLFAVKKSDEAPPG